MFTMHCGDCSAKHECFDKGKCIRRTVMARLKQSEYPELSEVNAPSPIVGDYRISIPLTLDLNEIEPDDPLHPDFS